MPPPTAADIAKSAPTITPAPQAAPAVAPATQARHHRNAAPAAPEVTATAPAAAPAATAPVAAAPAVPSERNCAKSLPVRATACSAAKARGPASRHSTASAITRRSGSITARRARARPKPSPICAASMPTASSRPNIRCPISKATDPPQWRRPSSNSPTRSSPSRATPRTAACIGHASAGYLLQSGSGRTGRRARRSCRLKNRRRSARQLSPQHSLYKALKAKLAEARNQKGDNASRARLRAGAQDRQGAGAGRARAAFAREARPCRRQVRHHLRQGAGRRRRQIPEEARASGERDAQRRHGRRAQWPAPRPRRRHHHRQYGTLALDAARSRQDPCRGQHSGLHAAADRATTSSTGIRASSSASPTCRRRS